MLTQIPSKIYRMLSRILLIPFVAGVLYFLNQMWENPDTGFNIWILPFVIGGVIIYLFSPQIDWWWDTRNPPELDERMRNLLQKHHVFYRNLDVASKKRFRNRMALYMKAKEYRPMGGPETVPHDVMGFIAAAATQITFGQEDFLMDRFEHIIIYPGAFPSPQYPKDLHNSEHYTEDGVIMFAVKSIMDSTIYSPRAYHIGLHEYANVFKASFPNKAFPNLEESIWQALEAISGMSKDFIHDSVGIPEVEAFPASVHHFFIFSKKFKELSPQLYADYVDVFNLDPLQGHSPVVVEKDFA